MSAYAIFVPARATEPDPAILIARLRQLDNTAGATRALSGAWTVKKETAWTPAQQAAVQNLVDTVPALTPQSAAQTEIDGWPIALRALVLALLDQINVLRGQLGLAAITPAQALAAVRQKAGTLTD